MEDRAEREIRFPNVEGYRVVFPRKPLNATFTADSQLVLTPDDIPTVTQSEPLMRQGHQPLRRRGAEGVLCLGFRPQNKAFRFCDWTRRKLPLPRLRGRGLKWRVCRQLYNAAVGFACQKRTITI